MVAIGLAQAPVPLKFERRDRDLVGLGSFLVNVVGDCNGCHTKAPSLEYLPSGNPYFRSPPQGPYLGTKQVNPATYLAGGSDFGVWTETAA
jgi:hypothetical protein